MAEHIERLEACKDCIHFDVCFIVRKNGEDRVLKNSPCKYFKNKADVTEVRHGDWVIVGGDVGYEELVCNQCGHSDVIDDYDDLPNYCPSCGAKMDGKGE